MEHGNKEIVTYVNDLKQNIQSSTTFLIAYAINNSIQYNRFS